MKEGYTKSTRYEVLDVREIFAEKGTMTVVLICKEHKKIARRRIEVHQFFEQAYKDALTIAPGDIILVHESYNKNGWAHHIDSIEY